jgi:hypothetical protein
MKKVQKYVGAFPVFFGAAIVPILTALPSKADWAPWVDSESEKISMRISNEDYFGGGNWQHRVQLRNNTNSSINAKCTFKLGDAIVDTESFSLAAGQSSVIGGYYWIDGHRGTDYNWSCKY